MHHRDDITALYRESDRTFDICLICIISYTCTVTYSFCRLLNIIFWSYLKITDEEFGQRKWNINKMSSSHVSIPLIFKCNTNCLLMQFKTPLGGLLGLLELF